MDFDEKEAKERIAEWQSCIDSNNEEIDSLKKKRDRLDEAREKIYNQQVMYSDDLSQNHNLDLLLTDERWKGLKYDEFYNSINDILADSIGKLETDMENSWMSLEDEIYDIDEKIEELESENDIKSDKIEQMERLIILYGKAN